MLTLLSIIGLTAITFWAYQVDSIESRYARIDKGMTESEVELILGVAAGDYRSKSRRPVVTSPGAEVFDGMEDGNVRKGLYSLRVWYFDHCQVDVTFDQNGRMVYKSWNAESNQPSLWDRLLKCLGI
jgi:hypothetical protein